MGLLGHMATDGPGAPGGAARGPGATDGGLRAGLGGRDETDGAGADGGPGAGLGGRDGTDGAGAGAGAGAGGTGRGSDTVGAGAGAGAAGFSFRRRSASTSSRTSVSSSSSRGAGWCTTMGLGKQPLGVASAAIADVVAPSAATLGVVGVAAEAAAGTSQVAVPALGVSGSAWTSFLRCDGTGGWGANAEPKMGCRAIHPPTGAMGFTGRRLGLTAAQSGFWLPMSATAVLVPLAAADASSIRAESCMLATSAGVLA